MATEYTKNEFLISNDKKKLNVALIHKFLSDTYWSKGASYDRIFKSIKNSECFGLYKGKEQIGFARVITDYTTFAYLLDVFVVEKFRSLGLSKWLLECIFISPEFKDLKRWMLSTEDAHELYVKFGFKKLDRPEKFMEHRL